MILGIGHQRGVGKDVAAMEIGQKFYKMGVIGGNSNTTLLNTKFAKPLYEVCHKLYAWAGFKDSLYYFFDREAKEAILPKLGKSPRQILIETGMAMREIFPDTWLEYGLNQEADLVILSDVRFQNEAKAIQERGGYLLKVTRPGLPPIDDPSDPDNQLCSFNNWDFHIHNDGTREDYIKQVHSFAETFKEEINV